MNEMSGFKRCCMLISPAGPVTNLSLVFSELPVATVHFKSFGVRPSGPIFSFVSPLRRTSRISLGTLSATRFF